MLNLGNWYTFKMDIDVPANTVVYSIYNASGASVKSVSKALNKASQFVAPVLSLDSFNVYGFNIYLDDIKITRETFAVKSIETTEEGSSVTATVQVANDVWDSKASVKAKTAAPRLIVATYDSQGNLVGAGMSESGKIAAKTSATAELAYSTLTAAAAKPSDGNFTIKTFLWSDMSSMTPYTENE